MLIKAQCITSKVNQFAIFHRNFLYITQTRSLLLQYITTQSPYFSIEYVIWERLSEFYPLNIMLNLLW